MIIALTGTKGSGKSTAARIIKRLLQEEAGIASVEISFADEIKRICMSVFNFSEDQLWGPSENREVPDTRYPREHHIWRGAVCASCGQTDTRSKCFLTPRYALQTLGTEWGRGCYDAIWVSNTLDAAERILLNSRETQLSLFEPSRCVTYDRVKGIVPLQGAQIAPTVVVVIPDVRFVNEAKSVGRLSGRIQPVLLLRIKKPGDTARSTHQSETEMDKIYAPYAIINDGHDIEKLTSALRSVLSSFPDKLPILPHKK